MSLWKRIWEEIGDKINPSRICARESKHKPYGKQGYAIVKPLPKSQRLNPDLEPHIADRAFGTFEVCDRCYRCLSFKLEDRIEPICDISFTRAEASHFNEHGWLEW